MSPEAGIHLPRTKLSGRRWSDNRGFHLLEATIEVGDTFLTKDSRAGAQGGSTEMKWQPSKLAHLQGWLRIFFYVQEMIMDK
jgi:hypothetical protein